MTSKELYNNFLTMVNQLGRNKNTSVSIGTFVLLYNHFQVLVCKNLIDKTESDSILDMQFLLSEPVLLKEKVKTESYYLYSLPNDYLKFGSSYTVGSKNNCRNVVLYNAVMKPQNSNALLDDDSNKPSFEFEHVPVTFASNAIQVYYSDFEINGQFLSYYRTPNNIDIAGYVDSNGQTSSTIDPETPEWISSEILKSVSISVSSATGNTDIAQIVAMNKNI